MSKAPLASDILHDGELPLSVLKRIVAAHGGEATRKVDEQTALALAPTADSAPAEPKAAPAAAAYDVKTPGASKGVLAPQPTASKVWFDSQKPATPPAAAPEAGGSSPAAAPEPKPAPAKPPGTTTQLVFKIDVVKSDEKVLAKWAGGKLTTQSKGTLAFGFENDKDGKKVLKVGPEASKEGTLVHEIKLDETRKIQIRLGGSAMGAAQFSAGEPGIGFKLGGEGSLDKSIALKRDLGNGEQATVEWTSFVKVAANPVKVGYSKDKGFQLGSEFGASVGTYVGAIAGKGDNAIGVYYGLEKGAAAGVKGTAVVEDGVIKLQLHWKGAAGLGFGQKIFVNYDTKWVGNVAKEISAEAKNPNSELSKALASAKDSTVQKVAVYTDATAKKLDKVAKGQGELFGSLTEKASHVTGAVGKILDRNTSLGDKAKAVGKAALSTLGVYDAEKAIKDAVADIKDPKASILKKGASVAYAVYESAGVVTAPVFKPVQAAGHWVGKVGLWVLKKIF